MKKILYSMLALSTIFMLNCGGNSTNNEESDIPEVEAQSYFNNSNSGTSVNVSVQQKPKLMILPSDQLLQKFNMLKKEDAQGKTIYIREYNEYLLTDKDSKFIIGAIQKAFIDYGFPLDDLEQTLKSINDQDMLDDVDGIQKDAKTQLLTTVKPDIILELDYDLRDNMASRAIDKTLTFTIRAIDAFTNQVVATIQQTEFGKGTGSNGADKLMEEALAVDGVSFTNQIDRHFGDIIENGRTITVRCTLEKNVSFGMDDDCASGDTYADWIIDYVKVNALNGAYTLSRNTDTEIYFTNVKIKTLNDDGTQFSAYDFARAMSKAMNKTCGVKSKNKTQGLGDALISIKGM